jgi:hypothetical protein
MQQTQALESTTLLRPGSAPLVPEFEIIPVKGLPIIGVVIVALVAAIEYNRLWPLEFFHIVGGGMWTAIDLFVGFIIGPILGRLSVQARIEFLTRFMPKMVLLMPTRHSHPCRWLAARQLYTGDIAVTYPDPLVADGVIRRRRRHVLDCDWHTGTREPRVLFELKKPVPDGELIGRLMRRFVYTAGITGVMQVATLIIMTRIATW